MSNPTIIAVDAGGSKTDIAWVSSTGKILKFIRGLDGNYQCLGLTETQRRYQALIDALALTDEDRKSIKMSEKTMVLLDINTKNGETT